MTIHTALLALAKEIANPIKTADNPHFKSKFAPLCDMVSYLRPLLAAHGLVMVQATEVGDYGPVILTTIYAADGSKIEGRYPLEPSKKDPQGYAAAMTYGRRYAMMGMLGIAGDDDDGEQASRPAKVDLVSGEARTKKVPWTDEDKAKQGAIRAEIIKYGGDEADAEFSKLWKTLGYTEVQAALAQLAALRGKWYAVAVNEGRA